MPSSEWITKFILVSQYAQRTLRISLLSTNAVGTLLSHVCLPNPILILTDNRPQPKPHFAAVSAPAQKLAPAVLQLSGSGSGSSSSRSNSARPSLVPNPGVRPRAASRVPRVSAFSGAGMGFQPFALPRSATARASIGGVLSEKDIDERVGSVHYEMIKDDLTWL